MSDKNNIKLDNHIQSTEGALIHAEKTVEKLKDILCTAYRQKHGCKFREDGCMKMECSAWPDSEK